MYPSKAVTLQMVSLSSTKVIVCDTANTSVLVESSSTGGNDYFTLKDKIHKVLSLL